jgi:hypothetical protein
MLLPIEFEELIFFESIVNCTSFLFLLLFFNYNFFVLSNNIFILPSSPYFVLNLFLLFRCLLNCSYYTSLSSTNFNHLVSFILLDYHFTSSFLSLVLTFFILNSFFCFAEILIFISFYCQISFSNKFIR